MLSLLAALALGTSASPSPAVFKATDPASKPWVYWYFMEGNMTREGLAADLDAMKKAGIGGAIMLEVNIGVPVGPVKYMSPEWLGLVGYALQEAKRQGISVAMGTGPGWCGAGGPWVKPEDAMQLIVSSSIEVEGPTTFSAELPRPKPRPPFFGMDSMLDAQKRQWESFYEDEAVVAVPAGEGTTPLKDLDEKALFYRAPYSGGSVRSTIEPETRTGKGTTKSMELTSRFANGRLSWQVPPGKWTIYRFGRSLTGATTRPAPYSGFGLETDKFETRGIDAHLDHYMGSIIDAAQGAVGPAGGLTNLHFDSWEMSSQNWSPHFRQLFRQLRGYDPVPFLPVLAGRVVTSVDVSERFLWDLRQTAQELVSKNQVDRIKQYGKRYGLLLDIEPYDMNPTADLTMGAIADVPMAEFWSKDRGPSTEYSVDEAVSIAHTNGRNLVGAESFTADPGDSWRQHPGSMKAQTDWALATGINRIVFHRYQHQPDLNAFPGMAMGPYGVYWEATETWWDMVPAYHAYINRCQYMLKLGKPVADILYLVPEGAPNVFQPPVDARIGDLQDRREYNYDGCSPETFIERASVKNGLITFPDGPEYRVLVLPRNPAMTPRLLKKLAEVTQQGATVIGNLPERSPSLENYPQSDEQVRRMAAALRGKWIADTDPTLSGADVEGAQWIWKTGGDPRQAVPVGTETFEKEFTIGAGTVRTAIISATADNRLKLQVNGKTVSEGSDFRRIQSADIASHLRPGTNRLTLIVTNEGETPNPAGVIAKLKVQFEDGRQETLITDAAWPGCQALGDWRTSPWGLGEGSLPRKELYPSYAFVSKLLSSRIPPEIESSGELRYAHRHLDSGELFFIGNRNKNPFRHEVAFRALGQPEWWDPMTGEVRVLPEFTVASSTTSVTLGLEGNASGFVFFRKGPARPGKGVNFPRFDRSAALSGDWRVEFRSPLGGPSPLTMNSLFDWSKSIDPKLCYFSGKAVYTTTFGGDSFDAIDLGVVCNAALVKINGIPIGTAWCAPFRLAIPKGVLKKEGNSLEVTIANLWVNRLIGDAGLPADQRVAKTTWNPYRPDTPLLPSGLLGPVRLLTRRSPERTSP